MIDNIDLDYGLVPPGPKPSPESIVTTLHGIIWRH